MKTKNKLITLTLFFSLVCNLSVNSQKVDSIINNNAFQPGEKLIYEVSYGLIKGGEATMSVDVIQSGDDFYYYLRASAQTGKFVSNFAFVNDIYESWVRITTGFPVKAARNITENNYKRYEEVYFYRNENFVYEISTGKHWIPANCHDFLSAFYYARQTMFKSTHFKDEIIDVTTFHDRQLYPVKIKFQKTEKIRTKFGKVQAHRFVPILEKDNPFKKEDDLQIWISSDNNFIPLKIKVKTKFGSVSAELISYENLKNPFQKVK